MIVIDVAVQSIGVADGTAAISGAVATMPVPQPPASGLWRPALSAGSTLTGG